MVAIPKEAERFYTPEEYLALERAAEYKSEYLNGKIYAMSGGSPEHGMIAVNVGAELRAQLKGRPCQVYSSDVKVRSGLMGLFSYPDLSVVCGEPHFHDAHQDIITNPVVLVEVLSPSTENFDRVAKFERYQRIASFTDYLLIRQDRPRVEHFSRQQNDQWLLTIARRLDSQITIASIDCTLALSEVYDKVTFPPFDEAEDGSHF